MTGVFSTTPTRSQARLSFAMVAMLLLSMFSSILMPTQVLAKDTHRDLAAFVPSTSVMFMSLDLNQADDQWGLVTKLVDNSGLGALLQDETGASTEDLTGMAESLGFDGSAALVFTDAAALAQYADMMPLDGDLESTVALTDAAELSEDVPEGMAILLQPTDPDTAVTMVSAIIGQDEATAQTVDYNGVTITYYEPQNSSDPGMAVAVAEGVVVMSPQVSDLEPVLDAIQGTTPNLADETGYTSVSDKLSADTLLFGYMNLDAFVDAMAATPDALDGMSIDELDTARGHVGFAAYASADGFHFDTVFIPNDPSVLQDAPTFKRSMDSKIPADVLFYASSGDLSSSGLSDNLGAIMQMALSVDDEGNPVEPTPTVEDVWTMMQQQLGFNPDSEFIALLDGDFAGYVGVYDLDGEAGIPSIEVLFVAETTDGATLDQTTTTIANMVNVMAGDDYTVSSRAVTGGELTVITIDPAITDGMPVVIEFGVVGDELLIGMNGAIDRYLDPSAPKIGDDATFQRTFDLLPSENLLGIQYMNIEGQVFPIVDWAFAMYAGSMSFPDNSELCGDYATQSEAQEAYDDDPDANWTLDMNFDGIACEDYFAEATPDVATASITESIQIPALGSVSWTDGEAVYTNSVLVIGD